MSEGNDDGVEGRPRMTAVQRHKQRTDAQAAARATELEGKLQEPMDDDTRSRLTVEKLSAEGQVRAAEKRALSERILGGGGPKPSAR